MVSVAQRWWLLRRNIAVHLAALLPLVTGLLALRFESRTTPLMLIAGFVGTLTGVVTIAYVALANPKPVARRGRLDVGKEGIELDGAMIATRASMTEGFVARAGSDWHVHVERRWPRPTVLLGASSEKDAKELLEHLELDASRTVASFKLESRAARGWVAAIAAFLVVAAFFGAGLIDASGPSNPADGLPALLRLSTVGIIALYALFVAVPRRLVIGADGLLLSWLGWRKFVSFEGVYTIGPVMAGSSIVGAALMGRYGPSEVLRMRGRMVEELRARDVERMQQRLGDAFAEYKKRARDAAAAIPERGVRPVADWVRALRALGHGANADHRTAPVEPEALLRVIEDPSAKPEKRAGAAIAYAARGEDARKRLRIAAESTASPEIRAVFELAAEEADEAPVAAALDRLRA